MQVSEHAAYQEETERFKYTMDYVEKSFQETLRKKENIDHEVEWSKKHLSSDSSQDYINLMISITLQNSISLKMRNLEDAKHKPYFARLDFQEEGKNDIEKLYIGKMCLSRDEDQELIIIDWRAPVANLYYDGRLGQASYVCPEGTIQGEIRLKRQFSIDQGMLQGIFDIDIATADELLQNNLGAKADHRLKDIVSTIQTEQNSIIRADMWTPLIVQGAAGSGKTTIALHRIAYLIYTYEKKFDPENFMIIAPNRLFLNYISDVLPDLGVEKVKQTTFEDFAMELIGKKFKVKDGHEKLTAFVNHNGTQQERERNLHIKEASLLKASMVFKNILDDYIATIEQAFIPREDFTMASQVLFEYEEINRLFLEEYRRLPLVKRIHEIKKHLTNRLKLQKHSIISHIEEECYEKIKQLKIKMKDTEERQRLIIEELDKKDDWIGKIEKYAKKAVNEYVKKISKVNPFQYYKDFFTRPAIACEIMQNRGVNRQIAQFFIDYSSKLLASGWIELEDFAPIIYLKYRIYGMDEKIPVRHIVIDEAQDFSVFQFYVLKKIVKDSSFTILGDLCQGIHSYRGTKDWQDVQTNAFEQGKSQMLTLEQSYRTTVEIMQAANKVISCMKDKNLVMAKPVVRHGEAVEILQRESIKEIAQDIKAKIHELQKKDYKSIAVICKTMEEGRAIHGYFKKMKGDQGLPSLITGKEKEYRGGVVIVPSYLAKGLEFDAVMIANADAQAYKEEELDIKLLYVSMTRPLHKLYIYYHRELSPLLK